MVTNPSGKGELRDHSFEQFWFILDKFCIDFGQFWLKSWFFALKFPSFFEEIFFTIVIYKFIF